MARRKGLSFYDRKRKRAGSSVFQEVVSWGFGIFASVFLAVVVVMYFGMTINVVGESMRPGLYNGQKVYVNEFVYLLSKPKTGDVVVFLPNGNEHSHYYVKRVVAVPGDHLVIRDGCLYVNGLESAWVSEEITDPGIAANDMFLDAGEYFCIGDDPNNSEDSRSANIGPVSDKDIIGKVWFRSKYEDSSRGFVK